MLLVVQIIVFAFLFFLVYASVAKYHPKDIEEVCHSSNPSTLKEEQEYSVLTWNTGYCGLDKSMDFFYDGGTRMRTSMEETEDERRMKEFVELLKSQSLENPKNNMEIFDFNKQFKSNMTLSFLL